MDLQGDGAVRARGAAPPAVAARLRQDRQGARPDRAEPGRPASPAPTFFGAYGEWMQTPLPTWEDVAWLREQWGGPFMLKGVMRVDDAKRAVDAGCHRHLGVQPRRQQPRRHPGADPGPARDRRGRRRSGRGRARRRHPARQRRRQGAGARCPGGDDRPRLPVGPGRQRAGRRGERARHPARRHRLRAAGSGPVLGARPEPGRPASSPTASAETSGCDVQAALWAVSRNAGNFTRPCSSRSCGEYRHSGQRQRRSRG